MITLQNLLKSYKKGRPVLKDIDFYFEASTVYGVVGNNGDGKTTLFRCIYGLEKNYGGSIKVANGQIMKDICGYLPAEPFFYARITGMEYLEFMTNIKRATLQALPKWREVFPLPLEEYVTNYSTGMKKKIALLGLLLQDNDIYIFDEPFNGLDLASSLTLKQIIGFLKAKGKTVLISSHILSTLTESCDNILLLRDGVIKTEYSQSDFNQLKADLDKDFAYSVHVKLQELL